MEIIEDVRQAWNLRINRTHGLEDAHTVKERFGRIEKDIEEKLRILKILHQNFIHVKQEALVSEERKQQATRDAEQKNDDRLKNNSIVIL